MLEEIEKYEPLIQQDMYDIYDSVENDTIGCDYVIEKKDALENLKEN